MRRMIAWLGLTAFLWIPGGMTAEMQQKATLDGEQRKWHKITLSFEGPELSESGTKLDRYVESPFRDYRLNVTFAHPQSGKVYLVPGYFAADGNAAETGASRGNIWRVLFSPDETGEWRWKASFRRGRNIAVQTDDLESAPVAFDGLAGSFTVAPTDKTGRDFRARGRLDYVGRRYLRFSETGEYFLKGGADSPENFLAYFEFDGTYSRKPAGSEPKPGEARPSSLHRFEPHAKDWRPGDPAWQGTKGKNIIGALNYLASRGMNSVYFLTMNVNGDGDDVWPWTSPEDRYFFDCSKLDQWEVVFSQMDRLGLVMHVVTQETENDALLDSGELGLQRKLYYRELIARFSHHLGVVWNLGEENVNTDRQRKAFSNYIRSLDPYDHPIVVHTYPGDQEEAYTPLLGFPAFEGPSLQISPMNGTHAETVKWIDLSGRAGRQWFVSLDEIGPSDIGVKPDAEDPGHDEVQHLALWANLMAGGAGCEWYFGYKSPNNDLGCEDWRSRENMWRLTRLALDFFHRYLPFWEMNHADALTSNNDDFCLAKPGEVYAIYLPADRTTDLDLGAREATYRVSWYNPRTGGALQAGSLVQVAGPGKVSIGKPPSETGRDWVALLMRETGRQNNLRPGY